MGLGRFQYCMNVGSAVAKRVDSEAFRLICVRDQAEAKMFFRRQYICSSCSSFNFGLRFVTPEFGGTSFFVKARITLMMLDIPLAASL